MTNLGAHSLDIVDWFLGLDTLRSRSRRVGGRFALTDNGETPDTQDALFDCGTWSGRVRNARGAPLGPRTGYGVEFHGTKGTLGITRSGFTVTPDADVPPVNMIPGVKEGHPIGGPKAVPTAKPTCAPRPSTTGPAVERRAVHRAREELPRVHQIAEDAHLPTSPAPTASRSRATWRTCRCDSAAACKWDWKTNSVPGDAEANTALVRPYRAPWDKELKALGVG